MNAIDPRRRASVAELKAKLSAYLRVVKSGGEIIVTERGTPVARIVPVGPELSEESRVSRLARAGLVREPRRPFDPELLEATVARDPAGRSLRIALDEREDGP